MGGAIDGQVVMWDITKALTMIEQKKRKQSVRHIGKPGLGFGEDEEVAAVLPPVKPCAVSHIDMSHRRLVADLVWLPTTTQVKKYDRWTGLQGCMVLTRFRQDMVCLDRWGAETVEGQRWEVMVGHESVYQTPTDTDRHGLGSEKAVKVTHKPAQTGGRFPTGCGQLPGTLLCYFFDR